MALAQLNKNAMNFQVTVPSEAQLIPWTNWEPDAAGEKSLLSILMRLTNVEQALTATVRKNELMSQIALSEEWVFIRSDQIYMLGSVTLWDWVRDVTGRATGVIAPGYSRIRGGVIETEQIVSHSGDSYIDLDAGLVGHDIFIKCGTNVQIDNDGGFMLGNLAATYLTFDPDTGLILFNIESNSDSAGLAIGSVPKTTGYLISNKGIRGYSGGDLVLVHALENITEGDWAGLTAGDFGVGDKSANHYVFFDMSAGKMYFRGEINADDIVAGTITGRTLRTAASGLRFTVSSADGFAYFYDAGGVQRVKIGSAAGDGYTFRGLFGNPANIDDISGIGGYSDDGVGVLGNSKDGFGVYGISTNNYGVIGVSFNDHGVYGAGDVYGLYTPDGLYVADGGNVMIGSVSNVFTLHYYDELHAEWIVVDAYIS